MERTGKVSVEKLINKEGDEIMDEIQLSLIGNLKLTSFPVGHHLCTVRLPSCDRTFE